MHRLKPYRRTKALPWSLLPRPTVADLTLSGDELRARIKRLGITYAEAAERLGLTLGGLNKQMRGEHKVSRQTALLLGRLETEWDLYDLMQATARGQRT
jgi:transcriptional regulator with XRE-family HTH domain